MFRLFVPALAAVLALGFATTSVAAPAVNNVTPTEGTIGTALTITGMELGTKAPKVALKLHGDATAKPIPLKTVKPYDGTTIHAVVLKSSVGVFDLVVTPFKGQPIVVDSAFTGRAPVVDSLSAAKAAWNELLTINGRFFGTKRGKVLINGVKQTIKKWVEGQIVVKIAKKTGAGTFNIDILGAGGTTTNASQVQTVQPIAGADYFRIDFDNGGPDMVCHDIKNTTNVAKAVESPVAPGQSHLVGTKAFGGGASTNVHSFDVAVVGPLTEGSVFTVGTVIYNENGIALRNFMLRAGTLNVAITQRAGLRLAGTFSCVIDKLVGGGTASYTVTGDFILTVH